MTDKYADLRAALDAGPTPGEWVAAGPSFGEDRPKYLNEVVAVSHSQDCDGLTVAQAAGGLEGHVDADMAYIATANPETIRALLNDYDRLWAAAKQVDALYPNVWDLVDGSPFIMPENVKRFVGAFDALRTALAQEQP